jgi:serine/threonine-protein kinase RsbW
VLTIEDEGVSFDQSISQEVDTKADLKDREIGGIGLHVVETMVDEIQYERTEKNINRLTLTKKIHK